MKYCISGFSIDYRPNDSNLDFFVVAVVQSLICVLFFSTLWTATRQAPLSSTISRSLLKFMSVGSVMLSNHLIVCHPLLLLPSIFPSISHLRYSVLNYIIKAHITCPSYFLNVADRKILNSECAWHSISNRRWCCPRAPQGTGRDRSLSLRVGK